VRRGFSRLLRETTGQDLTEYALLLVLIALAVAAVLPAFASVLADAYNNVAEIFTAKETCCD